MFRENHSMWRVVFLVSLGVACTKPNPAATCPTGVCSDPEFGFCDVDGAVSGTPATCISVDCSPGDFAACRGDQAVTCNATGDDFDLVDCPFGCGAEGCQVCMPNESACSDGQLFRCDADGNPVMEPCVAGCVDDANPHCGYLEPRYAPDICDAPAATASLVLDGSGMFDPNLDANCTGGIIQQLSAPELCVVHYGSITLSSGASITISTKNQGMGRVIAFVADGDLSIEGELDVGAHAAINGPGGGRVQSGGSQMLTPLAAGGAGGRTVGGDGGNATQTGGANNGGAVADDPALLIALVGGAAALQSFTGPGGQEAAGGGGGGGVSLISCRGTVSISGTIDAGGGGGLGGAPPLFKSGFGGGAGGNVILQGLGVVVTGQIFSNGGAGGRGSTAAGTQGALGPDGSRSATLGADSGVAQNGEGVGGKGGFSTFRPGDGTAPTNASAFPGAGGGSTGFILVFTPAGIEPMLNPIAVSPPFQPNGVIDTR